MKTNLRPCRVLPRRGHAANGFTLLELLVATTITLLLAGVMLSVTVGTLALWRRAQDSSTADVAAKLALDMLERDLQCATHRKDGPDSFWLAADLGNTPGFLAAHGWLSTPRMRPASAESQRLVPDAAGSSPASITDARFGLSGVWLRFIAATAESGNEPALPRAISYQIARRPVSGAVSAANPAEVRYTFFRTFLGSQATFVAGYAESLANGGALANPGTGTDVLAGNVVDFGVWLYVRDSSGRLRRIYPVSATDLDHLATGAAFPDDSSRFPEVADVMIRILSEEGARMLEAMEKSNGSIARPAIYASDAEWWWAVVEANSRVYVRRVEIKGGAL